MWFHCVSAQGDPLLERNKLKWLCNFVEWCHGFKIHVNALLCSRKTPFLLKHPPPTDSHTSRTFAPARNNLPDVCTCVCVCMPLCYNVSVCGHPSRTALQGYYFGAINTACRGLNEMIAGVISLCEVHVWCQKWLQRRCHPADCLPSGAHVFAIKKNPDDTNHMLSWSDVMISKRMEKGWFESKVL